MKFETITNRELETLKSLILHPACMQVFPITEEDIANLTHGASKVILLSRSGDNLKQAIDNIDKEYIESRAADKVLIVIRCSSNYEIKTQDIPVLTDYIGMTFSSSCEIQWGLDIREGQEDNVKILVFTSIKASSANQSV